METPRPHIASTAEEAARAAADFVARLARRRTLESGQFTIALSGGSTPRRLYEVLSSEPRVSQVAWDRWRVFWGDERCVPPDHPESNYRMARESLLGRVAIPPTQVFRIRGEAPPPEAATAYEETLRSMFASDPPVFDLILVGVGEDGHTASLFAGTEALTERKRLVVANWVPKLGLHRVTFTLPLINAARNVAFLVTEGAKSEAVRQSLEPNSDAQRVPAARVHPTVGCLHWFLTAGAAAGLRRV